MRSQTALLLITASAFTLASLTSAAYSATIANGELIEDFSTLDYADLTNTTGLWNIVNQRAQAGAVAGGSASHPISFGDGSDGVLNLTSGTYTFDTDAHPSGYNFISVNIGSGVTLSVTGSNPLIVRSLTTMTISTALSADGGFALGDATANGVANDATFPAGPTGGTGFACSGTGGAGGNNPNASIANNGVSGIQADGSLAEDQGEVSTPIDGSQALTTPGSSDTFDTGGFYCGSGGGGGAAQANGTQYATGAAGGAGGGAIHLIAVGNLSVDTVSANGGNGGNGAIYVGASCSGNGGAGTGGAIWLQTLGTLSTSSTPTVAAGTGGTCNGSGGVTGFDGSLRCDFAQGSGPSYTVQSKFYDLGVGNAGFSAPTLSENTASGTITISYQGSADSVNFSSPTQDVTTLSNQGYRYLKFTIQFVTASGASGYPTVSKIQIPFQDVEVDRAALTLGCGTTYDHRKGDSGQGGMVTAFWSSLLLSGYFWTKLKRRLSSKS
jgi:hypothetical protein